VCSVLERSMHMGYRRTVYRFAITPFWIVTTESEYLIFHIGVFSIYLTVRPLHPGFQTRQSYMLDISTSICTQPLAANTLHHIHERRYLTTQHTISSQLDNHLSEKDRNTRVVIDLIALKHHLKTPIKSSIHCSNASTCTDVAPCSTISSCIY
jgi:hypothetical protein